MPWASNYRFYADKKIRYNQNLKSLKSKNTKFFSGNQAYTLDKKAKKTLKYGIFLIKNQFLFLSIQKY